MLQRLVVYGLLVIALIFTAETPRTQREEIGIVVFKAQDKQINPYQEEYQKLLYPTVRIEAGNSTGSGVVIGNDECGFRNAEYNYIITAAHVVNDNSLVFVYFFDYAGNSSLEIGWVTITDTQKDLALIKVKTDKPYPYKSKLADKDYVPYIFSPVWVVGASLGCQPRPTRGEVTFTDKTHWEINAPIVPGNSGGPVFNANTYELIGIAVWVRTYNGQLVTTMAGIIPIQQIYEFIQSNPKNSTNSKN